MPSHFAWSGRAQLHRKWSLTSTHAYQQPKQPQWISSQFQQQQQPTSTQTDCPTAAAATTTIRSHSTRWDVSWSLTLFPIVSFSAVFFSFLFFSSSASYSLHSRFFPFFWGSIGHSKRTKARTVCDPHEREEEKDARTNSNWRYLCIARWYFKQLSF